MATKKNTAVRHGDKEYSYYRITRTVGHEWKDGKKVPIKQQFYGTSKGAAEQKYKKYLEDQAAGKLMEDLQMQALKDKTFGEYAEEFTRDVLPTLNYAKSTEQQYERNYRLRIKDSSLSSTPISEVDTQALQRFYNNMPVSKQTLDSTHSWLAAFYNWMSANGYSDNALAAVIKPTKNRNTINSMADEIVIWEPNEIKLIYSASDSFRHRFIFLLMYYAGLRISECLGLKYGDIKDGIIRIRRQYYRGELKNPKYDSFRNIPAHDEILKGLAIHAERHEANMKKHGYTTDFIFTTSKGRLLDYHNVRDSFVRFYNRNGIPEKKLHAYRATFCTELCRAGVPIEVASKLMGHKNIEVTAKHYALVKQDVQIDAIKKLPRFD